MRSSAADTRPPGGPAWQAGVLVLAGRWVRSVACLGVLAGALHPLLAGLITFVVDPPAAGTDDMGAMMVFMAAVGAAVGLAVALAVGVLTGPAAVAAARRQRWGWLRPAVVAVPPAVLVVVAFGVWPMWPAGGEVLDVAEIVERLVWLHLGPALWVAAAMVRLTRQPPAR